MRDSYTNRNHCPSHDMWSYERDGRWWGWSFVRGSTVLCLWYSGTSIYGHITITITLQSLWSLLSDNWFSMVKTMDYAVCPGSICQYLAVIWPPHYSDNFCPWVIIIVRYLVLLYRRLLTKRSCRLNTNVEKVSNYNANKFTIYESLPL